jgi:hypothetical protein
MESQNFALQRHQITANSPIQSAVEAVLAGIDEIGPVTVGSVTVNGVTSAANTVAGNAMLLSAPMAPADSQPASVRNEILFLIMIAFPPQFCWIRCWKPRPNGRSRPGRRYLPRESMREDRINYRAAVLLQSGLIANSLIIGHHFSASAFCIAASAAGVCDSREAISYPSSRSRDRTS